MLAEIQHRLLGLEQAVTKAKGTAMGWTNIDERDRLIVKAVAEAATDAGLGDIKVRDFKLRTQVGTYTGIKITDSQHTHLSGFWRLVDDVRERTGGYSTEPMDEDMLAEAVRQTIESQKRELPNLLDADSS